jgi:hypothetical protein
LGTPDAPLVFVSYSSADRADAFELRALLKSHGCEVWLDFFDIRPTARLDTELSGGVASADVMCLLLSPTAVASRWVGVEIEHALARMHEGLRLLPVILRPCRIPDALGDVVGIDATASLASEPVRLRLARAVLGEQVVDDVVLLDAAQRALLADRELQERADAELPTVATALSRIREEPIREISLAVDGWTLPRDPPAILELVLDFDPMWSQSMSFFVARYREGSTWPPEFGFDEPPYTTYFLQDVKRVDAKVRFYDKLLEPSQHVDGTDLRDLPATFTLQLDGAEFLPAGPGIHLPQRLELPSLATLVDKRAGFRLIAHYPETGRAEELALDATDVDITIAASFRDSAHGSCTLFRSRHDATQRAVLRCETLRLTESAIEREALLAAYGIAAPATENRRLRVAELLERDEVEDASLDPDDRRLCARMSFGNALVEAFRGGTLAGFARTANLLAPLVFDDVPQYDDVMLIFRACASIIQHVAQREGHEAAVQYLANAAAVAQRAADVDPDEPDYARLRAEAAAIGALVYAEAGQREAAASAAQHRVATVRALADESPVPARVQALREALAESVLLAARYGLEELLPVDEWRAELDPEDARREDADAVLAGERDDEPPTWLRPVELDGWPTRIVASAMLRYELPVPKRWSESPDVESTSMNVSHVFRGPSPAEWLIVTAMEDSRAPHSDLANWIETALHMTGFPVVEMHAALEPPPQLLEWTANGRPQELSRLLDVDDARFYLGLAQLAGTVPRIARLYALLARRGTFAWKIVLSFDSACLPGMPERLVETNDHVRAGATFGALRLG